MIAGVRLSVPCARSVVRRKARRSARRAPSSARLAGQPGFPKVPARCAAALPTPRLPRCARSALPLRVAARQSPVRAVASRPVRPPRGCSVSPPPLTRDRSATAPVLRRSAFPLVLVSIVHAAVVASRRALRYAGRDALAPIAFGSAESCSGPSAASVRLNSCYAGPDGRADKRRRLVANAPGAQAPGARFNQKRETQGRA